MELKIYKIKNKDGNFSTGTMHPRWTKKGKIWQSFGSIKLHLRQFCSNIGWNAETGMSEYTWKNHIPEDWVVLEITNNSVIEYIAKDLYPPTEN